MGLKLGLYVFHHNNNKNFNLINIYSAKTLMFCFANFFFTMLRVLCPFGTLQILFLLPPTRSTGPSLTSSGDQSTFIICSGQKIKKKTKKAVIERTNGYTHAKLGQKTQNQLLIT